MINFKTTRTHLVRVLMFANCGTNSQLSDVKQTPNHQVQQFCAGPKGGSVLGQYSILYTPTSNSASPTQILRVSHNNTIGAGGQTCLGTPTQTTSALYAHIILHISSHLERS